MTILEKFIILKLKSHWSSNCIEMMPFRETFVIFALKVLLKSMNSGKEDKFVGFGAKVVALRTVVAGIYT